MIIEVAGRPFFVLQGTVPAYRDMTLGESGSDIAQLQAGLEWLGFGIGGDTSGAYGPGTAAAVAAFYQSLGYTAPAIPGPKGHREPEVPLSEIMFIPRFPAQVIKLGGGVGSIVNGSLVTLSLSRRCTGAEARWWSSRTTRWWPAGRSGRSPSATVS